MGDRINMNLILRASILVAIAATAAANIVCDACVDGYCYENRDIDEGDCNIFHGIDIDRTTDTVYYTSYSLNNPFRECALHLKDNSTQVITVDNNYFHYTIDQKTRAVYAMPRYRRGVHKYDPINNTTEILLPEIKMRSIYFKDKLYFTTASGLYVYENKELRSIQALKRYSIYSFIVDVNNDIYFTYRYGKGKTFLLKNGTEEVVMFSEISFTYTTDKDEKLVFVTEQDVTTELYRVDNYKLVLIGVIGTCARSLLFDSDNNILYYNAFRRPRGTFAMKYMKRNNLHCGFTSNKTTAVFHVQIDLIFDYNHIFNIPKNNNESPVVVSHNETSINNTLLINSTYTTEAIQIATPISNNTMASTVENSVIASTSPSFSYNNTLFSSTESYINQILNTTTDYKNTVEPTTEAPNNKAINFTGSNFNSTFYTATENYNKDMLNFTTEYYSTLKSNLITTETETTNKNSTSIDSM